MKTILDYIILASTLLIASVHLLFSFHILSLIFEDYEGYSDTVLLFIILLGIVGYIGLWILTLNNSKKLLKVAAILISCGVIAMSLFIYLSGPHAWKWLFYFKEPGEWFFMMWPTLVSVFYIIRILIWLRISKN